MFSTRVLGSMMKTCNQTNCSKRHYGRGLCEMHYHRQRRHGDPDTRMRNANGEGGFARGGYVRVSINGNRVREHIVIAEKALGMRLPNGAIVHHVNETPSDNRPENLVICDGQGYHNFLHARINALRATGDKNSRPCRYCHQYDSLNALRANGTSHYRLACGAQDARTRRLLREEEGNWPQELGKFMLRRRNI